MDKKHVIFEQMDPPNGLLNSIFLKIDEHKKRAAKMNIIFSSFGAILSFTAFISVLKYAMEDFYQSGLSYYLSFLFSDPIVAFTYFKEFTLSVAESIPSLEVSILFFAIFVFLGSFKYIVENLEKISLKRSLA